MRDRVKKTRYWLEWRKQHPEYRNTSKKRYYDKTVNGMNSGNEWTEEEISMILNKGCLTDMELSEVLGRGVRAIQVKRSRLLARA